MAFRRISTAADAVAGARMAPVAVIQDGDEDRWLRFVEPVAVLVAFRVDEVAPVVAEAVARVEAGGLFAAGFLAYEAAPAFDRALAAHPVVPGAGPPLAWFALFSGAETRCWAADRRPAMRRRRLRPRHLAAVARRARLFPAIPEIKRLIARGDTYQVNLTYRLAASFPGDPAASAATWWRRSGRAGAPTSTSAASRSARRRRSCFSPSTATG